MPIPPPQVPIQSQSIIKPALERKPIDWSIEVSYCNFINYLFVA